MANLRPKLLTSNKSYKVSEAYIQFHITSTIVIPVTKVKQGISGWGQSI